MTLRKKLRLMATGIVAAMGLTLTVAAQQILTIDNDRVENEAAAHKDFNLQTADIRDQILQYRNYIGRGGLLEQKLAELEKQKSIIGNDKYEAEAKKLQENYMQINQSLQALEYAFDKIRKEALVQVERARQPVLKKILTERKAQVILPKRLVMDSAPGLDVTTEFIELLDAELPSVKLTLPQRVQQQAPEGSEGGQ
ncbi:OmpH family outer membrane protein [Kordiimonas pumila]|uniref:OmpH family outer membrane protein n=1 Tax=Kordiimonas pumila TaxID=2161677 RepID=A0ABV7D1U9_9PROT|nr:hypothetical protein [Kordiimonas pumila]